MLSRIFHQLHLWLGLITGVFAFLLCLSGTVLVAQAPIEHWVNRAVIEVVPSGEPQDLAVLIPRLQSQSDKPYTAITLPAAPNEALILRQGRAQTYVNPYTGEVLGGLDQGTRDFFMFWFRLHRWLLLDSETGRPITGAATLAFLAISLTGLWLWVIKARKNMRRALLLKFKKIRWRRLNYDLHLVLGFYALIPLLIMAWSGLFWSYRTPFVNSVHLVLNGSLPAAQEDGKPREKEADQKTEPAPVVLDYGKILATTTVQYPYGGDVTLQFPKTGGAPVRISKTPREHFWTLPARDQLTVAPETGALIQAEPFANRSPAEKVLGLIKAIHIGTVFSNVSLWIYFFAALIGTTLPLTGALHWAQRKQKQWKLLK